MKLDEFAKHVKITKTEYPTGAIILHGEFCYSARNVTTVDEQRPSGDAVRELIVKMWNDIFGDIYRRLDKLENEE